MSRTESADAIVWRSLMAVDADLLAPPRVLFHRCRATRLATSSAGKSVIQTNDRLSPPWRDGSIVILGRAFG